jgi:hypothetical protein
MNAMLLLGCGSGAGAGAAVFETVSFVFFLAIFFSSMFYQ